MNTDLLRASTSRFDNWKKRPPVISCSRKFVIQVYPFSRFVSSKRGAPKGFWLAPLIGLTEMTVLSNQQTVCTNGGRFYGEHPGIQ